MSRSYFSRYLSIIFCLTCYHSQNWTCYRIDRSILFQNLSKTGLVAGGNSITIKYEIYSLKVYIKTKNEATYIIQCFGAPEWRKLTLYSSISSTWQAVALPAWPSIMNGVVIPGIFIHWLGCTSSFVLTTKSSLTTGKNDLRKRCIALKS